MSEWWENHDNRIELAHHLLVDGAFQYPIDMLRYFEKPWKWDAEWEEMRANLVDDRDPTCGKCGGEGTVDTDDAVQNCYLYTIMCPDCGGTGMDLPTEEQLGLEDPEQWARVEEPDEDLRPTDVVLSSDPGWITP